MISVKYDPLQVMATITEKFHQNPLKTVGGVAATKLCLRMDGRADGRTNPFLYSPSTNVRGQSGHWPRRRCCLKLLVFFGFFSIFSSGGHFVQPSRTILAILVKGHKRNTSVKLL